MNWKILKTKEEYHKAGATMIEIFNAEPDISESEELESLILLINDYDGKNISLPSLNVLEVIKIKMQELGLKAKNLELIRGSKGHVSAILSGKREITLKMAQKLKTFFGIPAEVFLHSGN